MTHQVTHWMIVAGETLNAVLVPVQALREISEGQYAAFVVQPNGELEMRLVEIGLMDYVNAEIRSGLERGEMVSLGTATTTSAQSSAQPASGALPGGANITRFLGG